MTTTAPAQGGDEVQHAGHADVLPKADLDDGTLAYR
jgi:hypothetical protein